MPDPIPAPATDPVALERQRVRDLKAAFHDDRDFADEQIDKGASLADAKVAFADRAGGELKKLRAEKTAADKARLEAEQKLEAAQKAKAPSSTHVPGVRPAGEGVRASEDAPTGARAKFNDKVLAARKSGMSRQAAVASVAKEHPELHREVLAEANPGVPEPAYRAGRR